MFDWLLKPEEEGLRTDDFPEIAKRKQFSAFLPWLAYRKHEQSYMNSDNTVGRLWECSPLTFLAENNADALSGILRQEFPKETVLSFMLFPDQHIDPILWQYEQLKDRGDPVSIEAAKRYAKFLSDARTGMKTMQGIPTRNFRLIVSVKSPEPMPREALAQIEEGLAGAGLAPRNMEPDALLEVMRRLFNDDFSNNAYAYNDQRYLRSQIIKADTVIEKRGNTMWLGSRPAACLTPKTPADVEALSINKLIGGFNGREDDNTQLSQMFIWTTTVVFRTDESKVKSKASVMMAQRAGGSIAKELSRRVTELAWVLDDIENKPYCDVLTSFWVIGRDEDDLNKGLARARGLWERGKFVMQREDRIAHAMLIAALPFGLFTGKNYSNLNTLDRDFPMSCEAAARMLPVQADFSGRMAPAMILMGRKGQLATVDVFDKNANNNNLLVCAGSGAGKSFFTNFLASNYYGTGALMRLVDIGYSYEKQCAIRKGRFIDIGDPNNPLILNPFQTAVRKTQDLEDRSANRATVAQIVLAMVYSGTGTANITETHLTLCKQGVDFAYQRDGGEMGIDHVAEFLKTYPKHAIDDGANLDFASQLAHEMAFNLMDWTSKGRYGAMFNGKSTFDISSDDFVVLEMERLMTDEELFGVVSLQVLNAITQDLYLSDRSQRRFMLFDEAWKYLVNSTQADGAAGNSATTAIAAIIQEGYRRARKYGGATGIVTQSPLDLGKMGPAGEVIKGNSAFKFWLQCDPEEWSLAAKRDIVGYSGLTLELAASVKNNSPNYSEVFIDCPFGKGVSRLSVDKWTYWVNTSSPKEFALFKAKMAELENDPVAALTALADGG